MSKQGQRYLVNEIKRAMEYCITEYDMTWAEAIGCLYMSLHYITDVSMDNATGIEEIVEEDPNAAVSDDDDDDDEEDVLDEDDDDDDDDDEGEEWKKGADKSGQN